MLPARFCLAPGHTGKWSHGAQRSLPVPIAGHHTPDPCPAVRRERILYRSGTCESTRAAVHPTQSYPWGLNGVCRSRHAR